ncbi:biotin/lipoyl-binding protein [Aliiruegeria haliotis]|uniref:Biotin/lipoyl-binding protein n=1 Tax=Aliiruegeria haliotis TaxID=1280846 RepID=A0A2T0S0H3_9RHOB|nr:biotin/lipoyl-binding protein [Aliiruegeria haliotis]PRY26928.1 biotin/lipoyl-binding protein [Aliiruegeria haliotis]
MQKSLPSTSSGGQNETHDPGAGVARPDPACLVPVCDRLTPFSNNAPVKAVVTQIVPKVSGEVIEVNAVNGERVQAGAVLARVDPQPYEIARDRAQADLQTALQQIGAGSAQVAAAQARLARATTDLKNTQLQTARVFEMERKGLAAAEIALSGAKADLERAQASLGRRRRTTRLRLCSTFIPGAS